MIARASLELDPRSSILDPHAATEIKGGDRNVLASNVFFRPRFARGLTRYPPDCADLFDELVSWQLRSRDPRSRSFGRADANQHYRLSADIRYRDLCVYHEVAIRVERHAVSGSDCEWNSAAWAPACQGRVNCRHSRSGSDQAGGDWVSVGEDAFPDNQSLYSHLEASVGIKRDLAVFYDPRRATRENSSDRYVWRGAKRVSVDHLRPVCRRSRCRSERN